MRPIAYLFGSQVLQDFTQLSLRFLSAARTFRIWLRVKSRADAFKWFLTYSLRGNQSRLSLSENVLYSRHTTLISTTFCFIISPWLSEPEIFHWEIVMCVFMCVPFSKSTSLLIVFKVVHLLPDLSFFSPFFSFAGPPAHESLYNRLYFPRFYLPFCLSVFLPLFPFLPVQSELAACDADGILISSNLHPNNERSREPIHLFFSLLTYPPWTLDSSLSSSLSASASLPTAHITLLCIWDCGCLWKRVKYKVTLRPKN